MEISKEILVESLGLAKEKKLFNDVENIYSSIPSGKCAGCTKCCMESVNTFYIEFLNIYNYISGFDGMLDKVMEKVENHYFDELITKMTCPFLDEKGLCIIYPVRPLVCRTFGYLSKEEHENNYSRVLDMNKEAEEYFYEEYNIKLNEEVINHKIEYCNSFIKGRDISEEERYDMIDQMFRIDSEFLSSDLLLEDSFNVSLTNWFIYTKYTEDEASEIRINKLLENSK